ncbi:ENTH/ANTH/VHS superfamily protein [Quillaja saponaria]|uniref:ENTH/ANTH/VHS superfamily protein n=1 Tax=Quillaja saponaria TaxID=32244 RepID=A0AAD7Q6R7_QUISA|nr:ENTH/ANTH/VHS superfamily protein [Quillaja saponaria]
MCDTTQNTEKKCFEQQLREAHVSGHLQIDIRCFQKNSDPLVCFLHKYAAYLEERMSWLINQAGKLDPVMSKGLEFRCYDEKSIDVVFRRLPKCQLLIDKVLDCSPLDISPSDNLAQAAMSNILKESFQVYMTFTEAIAALVNMFFDLTTSARGLACEILQKASLQTQKLQNLYQNCKQIIGNKNLEYPSVQIINMDHVLALEQCLIGTQIQSTSSHVSLSSRSTGSKLPPIFSCLGSRSTELQVAITAKGGNKSEKKIEKCLSPTLFSCTMETKISMVWVVFEDEPLASHCQ